jgi:hypothetical protein
MNTKIEEAFQGLDFSSGIFAKESSREVRYHYLHNHFLYLHFCLSLLMILKMSCHNYEGLWKTFFFSLKKKKKKKVAILP